VGRDAKRVQRGGFASEEDARAELGRALERLRRTNGVAQTLTLAELVEQYLAQHDVSPVTLKKLRFLLARAVPRFGDYPLDELDPVESAAWRMSVPPGYRFEATQALRQVLAAPSCGGCSTSTRRSRASNPAKQGIANPQRRRTEKRPFESWEELEAVAERLGAGLGALRPPRARRTRARVRLLDEVSAPAVDVRGRPVDAETRGARRPRQRKAPLSRK
jgi:hypothetical protein